MSASAQAHPIYVGVQGGVLLPRNHDLDVAIDFSPSFPHADLEDAARARYKTGVDADAIVGVDLGQVRVEAEIGVKRAALRDATMSVGTVTVHSNQHGTPKVPNLAETSVAGRVRLLSVMLNGLVDIGAGRNRLFGGVGLGRARVSFGDGKDDALAAQLIGGVARRLSPRVEAGIKYRYLRTARLDFESQADLPNADIRLGGRHRFKSHSVLLSLVYHFNQGGGADF